MEREAETLERARRAFLDRDAVAATLRELDTEIAMLCLEYGHAMRTWGVRPEMLRNEVRAMEVAR